ncbi:MAG: hypothetical protein K6F00_06040 [Lachnospiraceae bacterium]|nr:hypothetical protein [Lachnospiraceae bacterium]
MVPKSLRRNANFGLYGSIAVVILTVIFHFSPFHITYQQPNVARWMLIAGTVLAVLAIVMVLMMVRKTTPTLRQLDSLSDKLAGYTTYITNLYRGTFAVVLIECVLIVLMSDTSLLMVTILLVLLLFLSYPNMYKMRTDLGLTDAEMTSLFGDQYISEEGSEEGSEEAPEEATEETTEEKEPEEEKKV